MDQDPADLLLAPGVFGAAKVPLRLHPIERELHTISSAAGRMANALEKITPKIESIAKDIAVLREMVERSSR